MFFSTDVVEERPPYDKEMSLWEHLRELGLRLKKAVVVALAVFVISWLPTPDFNPDILHGLLEMFSPDRYVPISYSFIYYPILKPMVEQVNSTAALVGMRIIAGGITTPLSILLYTSLFITALITLPIFIYEIWAYIKPALYPHEIAVVRKYLAIGVVLFYVGSLFGLFVVTPVFLIFLVKIATILPDITPFFEVGSIITTAIQTAFWTGVVFLTPIVLAILSELCMLNPWSLAEYRPVIYPLALIAIAWITPDTSLVSTFLIFIPFVALMEIGILWGKRIVAKCPEIKPIFRSTGG